MISMSRAIAVNPPDAAVQLTRDDVWHGLELKARNALPFVKAMNRCEVIESGTDTLVRDIEIGGEPFRERLTLIPKQRVEFVRIRGRVLGTITNSIEEDTDRGLTLHFSFELEVAGVEPGGAEEREYERTMGESYLQAVDSTLAAVRRLVAERDGTTSTTA